MTDSIFDMRGGERAWRTTLALGLFAFLAVWRTPYYAADFEIAPDSTEYAVGAARLVRDGLYSLRIDGVERPLRYPPWFAAFILGPVFLFTDDLGAAQIPVAIFGAITVMLAFRIARRIGGDAGGALAALFILAFPMFRHWGGLVMTDIPSLGLYFASMALFVRAWRLPERRSRLYFLVGLLAALNFLVRPITGAVVPVFGLLLLREPTLRRKLVGGAALVLPLCLAKAADLVYTRAVFGPGGRSGYHYWSAVPYDYPELVFNTKYLAANFDDLVDTRLFWYLGAALGAGALARSAAPKIDARSVRAPLPALPEILFAAMTLVPMTAVHLFYYSGRPRYFLPALLVSLLFLGASLGRLLRGRWATIVTALAILGTSGLAIHRRVFAFERTPLKRIAAEEIRDLTPPDAVILTRIPVPYVEFVANREKTRTVTPVSRRDEYAQTVMTPKRIADPDPRPTGPKDYRCKGLLKGGAVEAVPKVARDRLEVIEEWVRSGRPVFLEATRFTTPTDDENWPPFLKRFELRPVGKTLFKLSPK